MLLFFLFLQGALRANTQVSLSVHRANTHRATLIFICTCRANTWRDTLILVRSCISSACKRLVSARGASSHRKIFVRVRGAISDDIFIRARGVGTHRLFPRKEDTFMRECCKFYDGVPMRKEVLAR